MILVKVLKNLIKKELILKNWKKLNYKVEKRIKKKDSPINTEKNNNAANYIERFNIPIFNMCYICWFTLHETLVLMLFQIYVFVKMVKLLEYKHFKIISHFCYLEFLICFVVPPAHSRHIFSSIEFLSLLLVTWILYRYQSDNTLQIQKTKSQPQQDGETLKSC